MLMPIKQGRTEERPAAAKCPFCKVGLRIRVMKKSGRIIEIFCPQCDRSSDVRNLAHAEKTLKKDEATQAQKIEAIRTIAENKAPFKAE